MMLNDPLNVDNLTPVELTWWHCLEGFVPLGVRRTRTVGIDVDTIHLEFMVEEGVYMTMVGEELGQYNQVKNLMRFWESLEM